jgi:hypothetical protein
MTKMKILGTHIEGIRCDTCKALLYPPTMKALNDQQHKLKDRRLKEVKETWQKRIGRG